MITVEFPFKSPNPEEAPAPLEDGDIECRDEEDDDGDDGDVVDDTLNWSPRPVFTSCPVICVVKYRMSSANQLKNQLGEEAEKMEVIICTERKERVKDNSLDLR